MYLNSTDCKIGYIGGCISYGQKLEGVELAPAYLRSQQVIQKLSQQCQHVFDFGDLREKEKEAYQALSKNCKKSAELFDLTLITGGDHSQSIGSVHGLKQALPNLKVIWIDAHGDINTPQTSPTGSLHGMPLAALLGLFNYSAMENWFRPVLRPCDVALIGVRDLDPGEVEILKEKNIFIMSTKEVQEIGVDLAVKVALRSIDPKSESPLHISFDLDCLSEEYIAATGVRVCNGLTPEMAKRIVRGFTSTGRVRSMEVVEFNPLLAKSEEELQYFSRYIYSLYLCAVQGINVNRNEDFDVKPIN